MGGLKAVRCFSKITNIPAHRTADAHLCSRGGMLSFQGAILNQNKIPDQKQENIKVNKK